MKTYYAITSDNGSTWRVLAVADIRAAAAHLGLEALGRADASDPYDQTARVNFRVLPKHLALKLVGRDWADREAVIIGTTPDGRVIIRHDGVTEWADCSVCGARLDPVNDADAPPHPIWGGSCYRCGAPAEKVGLAKEAE